MNCVRRASIVSAAVALLIISSNVARSESTVSSSAAVAKVAAEEQEKEYLELDPANFERPTVINNEWFPLKPGTRYVWEGTSVDDEGKQEPHRVVFTVTALTKEIGGVHTVVCWDQDLVDGELVETEIVFFAQDNDGAVWSLGEYPEEYEDGKFLAAPTWIHGIKDGKAGILVPAKPKLGTPSFSQGWAPSVNFTDRGVVHQMGQKTTVPLGTYDDVLVIDESNKKEPDAHALKYYARGVGVIRVGSRGTGDQEILELTKVEQLSAEELAKARDEALKLEKRAYEISKNVYAQTKPSEPRRVGSDRRYTTEFREAAVEQVIDAGRSMPSVARSPLEMSPKTLATLVPSTQGPGTGKAAAGDAGGGVRAEVARLRQENAKLRVEKEILKKAAYFARESM